MRKFLFVMLATIGFAPTAHGNVITLGFNDIGPTLSRTTNLHYNGFRLSPNCHMDVGMFFGHDSHWLGFDGADCSDINNPAFLGPSTLSPPLLWVDYDGAAFSLLSFFDVTRNYVVRSSNGGFFDTGFVPGKLVSFSGAAWSNISWLLFEIPGGAGAPFGFDDLTVEVPEPNSILLFMLGLFGLFPSRCRFIGRIRCPRVTSQRSGAREPLPGSVAGPPS